MTRWGSGQNNSEYAAKQTRCNYNHVNLSIHGKKKCFCTWWRQDQSKIRSQHHPASLFLMYFHMSSNAYCTLQTNVAHDLRGSLALGDGKARATPYSPRIWVTAPYNSIIQIHTRSLRRLGNKQTATVVLRPRPSCTSSFLLPFLPHSLSRSFSLSHLLFHCLASSFSHSLALVFVLYKRYPLFSSLVCCLTPAGNAAY